MVRRKKKMYKVLTNLSTQSLGPNSTPVLAIKKQADNMRGAWIEGVRITVCDDGSSNNQGSFMGFITTSQTGVDDANIIGVGAVFTAGSFYIPVKRLITDNDYDENSGSGALTVIMEATTNYSAKVVTEVFGRWHKCTEV